MFPVKCVYTKPEGQRAYRGHYIASILAKKINGFFILFLDIQKNYQLLYLPLIVKTMCQKI